LTHTLTAQSLVPLLTPRSHAEAVIASRRTRLVVLYELVWYAVTGHEALWQHRLQPTMVTVFLRGE
jgi:hypothetical protein